VATLLYYLLHQLTALLAPVGAVWAALIVVTALLVRRRLRGLAIATGAIVLFITLIGSTRAPGKILASLERPYAGVKIEALPAADAIVLLGGGAEASRYEVANVHFTPAGDRLVMAAELMRLGKAPTLLLGGTGGKLDGREANEAVLVKALLSRWGVAPDAIIPLGPNGDTHDEALKVRALANERRWRRILLVTSANHMRRASAVFRHMDLDVIPVPCNFLTSVGTEEPPFSLAVPGHDGFVKMATWLHEEIGWFMYWRRGWLRPPNSHAPA
jgi:uncharacterized SAM-binding protein YcdF (DUF218 family)